MLIFWGFKVNDFLNTSIIAFCILYVSYVICGLVMNYFLQRYLMMQTLAQVCNFKYLPLYKNFFHSEWIIVLNLICAVLPPLLSIVPVFFKGGDFISDLFSYFQLATPLSCFLSRYIHVFQRMDSFYHI
jgi:hypothetical protein